MKPNFWTKICSYFFDVSIEKRKSSYSEELEVVQRKGRLALFTQSAVYSFEDLYFNFSESFQQIDLDKLNIQDVLVLGLGLGSIPQMLEQKFNKNYHYTLVEIDPAVIALAQKYTLPLLNSQYTIVEEDALAFVQNTTQQFDLIAIDIFIDDLTPSQFETLDFLQATQQCLAPNGLLMYNRLTYNKVLAKKTNNFYSEIFNKIFTKSCFLHIKGNKMLLSGNFLK